MPRLLNDDNKIFDNPENFVEFIPYFFEYKHFKLLFSKTPSISP